MYKRQVSLRVEKVEGPDIYCKVVDGGVISDQKGVTVPDTNLSMPYLSEQMCIRDSIYT